MWRQTQMAMERSTTRNLCNICSESTRLVYRKLLIGMCATPRHVRTHCMRSQFAACFVGSFVRLANCHVRCFRLGCVQIREKAIVQFVNQAGTMSSPATLFKALRDRINPDENGVRRAFQHFRKMSSEASKGGHITLDGFRGALRSFQLSVSPHYRHETEVPMRPTHTVHIWV